MVGVTGTVTGRVTSGVTVTVPVTVVCLLGGIAVAVVTTSQKPLGWLSEPVLLLVWFTPCIFGLYAASVALGSLSVGFREW